MNNLNNNTTLSNKWLSAPTATQTQVNYKTANPEAHGEYQEYTTKYHNYSLEKLEKLEKNRTELYEDENGMLLRCPPPKRKAPAVTMQVPTITVPLWKWASAA